MSATLTDEPRQQETQSQGPGQQTRNVPARTANRLRTNPQSRSEPRGRHAGSQSAAPAGATVAPVRTDPEHRTEPQPHGRMNVPAPARQPGWLGAFWDRQPLEKLFVMFGITVAATMVLLFGCDLLTGWPFQRASVPFDVISILCGLGLGYLSWDTRKQVLT